MKKIKLFVMDVDGTLTDGKLYIGANGELFKAFSIKDGMGIKKLIKNGIIPVIITGRFSEIVAFRGKELGIPEIYQGVENKLACLIDIASKYGCSLKEIAYIGDDENDLECMRECGICGCPSNAALLVKQISHYCSEYGGGNGAVRDFIEYIIHV